MPRFIIKVRDHYLEWSTIVDAPVTYGMKREEFEAYYRKQYGLDGMRDLPVRMERVEKYGSSSVEPQSAQDIVRFNRAGPNEKSLRFHEVYRAYCLREAIRDGWLA